MPIGGWIAIAIVAVILICIIWFICTNNNFIKKRNDIDEAFSTMDVYMKKRYDLVPNLVSTIKGYCKHEKETFESVVNARNKALSAEGTNEKVKAESEFSGQLSKLLALSESYPEIKANTNFLDLQNQLQAIETEIANSRKYYNACVKIYNVKLQVFPSSIVANMKKYTKYEMFQITNAIERENVKIEF